MNENSSSESSLVIAFKVVCNFSYANKFANPLYFGI